MPLPGAFHFLGIPLKCAGRQSFRHALLRLVAIDPRRPTFRSLTYPQLFSDTGSASLNPIAREVGQRAVRISYPAETTYPGEPRLRRPVSSSPITCAGTVCIQDIAQGQDIGVQRQLKSGVVLSVDYIRNVQTHYLL